MTNFIIQTLVGFPVFCLVFLLLILTFKKNRLRVNNFFIVGSLLAAAQFIANELFWFGEPGVTSMANFSKLPGILFSPVFVLFLYGVLQTISENNLAATTRRKSVWTLALLFLVTFGFYAPFWFTEKYVKHRAGNLLVVIFAFFLTLSFFIHTYLYAERGAFGLAIWLSVDLLTIVLGIVLALNLRATMVKENDQLEIDPGFTFLFGMFYLQHRINQLDRDEQIG